MLLNLVEMI